MSVVIDNGVVAKHAGGRPTKYKDEYVDLAYKYCLLSATDNDLAKFFEVDVATVNKWKIDHPEFYDSIKRGKEIADAQVASRLYKRAIGYERKEDKIFQFKGEPVVVPTEVHYQPDTTAAIFWLKNRQPSKWRDTQNIELTGANGGPIEVQSINAMSDDDLRLMVEIMERSQIKGEVVDITPDGEDKDI